MPPIAPIVRIPIVKTSVPKPRSIPALSGSNVPGSTLSGITNLNSSVGQVDDGTPLFDPISDLTKRIADEVAKTKSAHTVDVAGLLKQIKASQSNWKPNVAGMIGPLRVTGGIPARAPTGGVKLSGGVDQWIATAYRLLGIPLTPSALSHERYLIQHESGGNPRAVNRWDINAKRGTPSIGIEQTIMPTFQRYKLPGHNDIYNPIDNILASLRYRKSRYGKYDIGAYSGGY
jgi:hypothetical protein